MWHLRRQGERQPDDTRRVGSSTDSKASEPVRRVVRVLAATTLLALAGVTAVGSQSTVAGANKVITIPPQAQNQTFALQPGQSLYAGYAFQFPGENCGSTGNYPPQDSCPTSLPLTAFTNVTGQISLACQDASPPNPAFVVIAPPDQLYTGQVGDKGWYPSGTESSALTYQGSVVLPDACTTTANHTIIGGATFGPFRADVKTNASPLPTSALVHWHYGPASVLGSNGGTGSGWSATTSIAPDPVPNLAAVDLSVKSTSGQGCAQVTEGCVYVPGRTLTSTVTISNAGLVAAVGARVSDPLPSALAGAGFTWKCAPSTGSACGNGGAGDIVDTVTVLGGGALTYTVSGVVPSSVEAPLSSTGTVVPPPGVTDPGCSPDCSSTTTARAAVTTGLSVSESSGPNPYAPGQNLTYTITVGNRGPSDAIGAAVSDLLPAALTDAGFTWVCVASVGSTCTPSGSGDVADAVDVGAGGSLTYTVSGSVPSSVAGGLTNTPTVTPPAGASDPGCDPECGATDTNPSTQVSLGISELPAPDPYVPGQPLSYTVIVTNGGPDGAVGAQVDDTLPSVLAGAGFAWACSPTVGSTCTPSGAGDISDTVRVLAGGTLTYTVTGTVPSSVQSPLANSVTVTPPLGESDRGCDPNCSSSTSMPALPLTDLVVSTTATPDPFVPGEPLTYSVQVSNHGPSDAINGSISDPLPPPLSGAGFLWTCVASPGSACTPAGAGDIADIVDVAAGGLLTYTVTGVVPASAPTTLANTATVTAPPAATDPGCDPNCSNSVTATTQYGTGLAVAVTASPDPFVPGGPLTYTVTVSNAGPSDALGAQVLDPLPANLPGASFSWSCAASAGSTCTPSGGGGIDDVVDLAAGGTLTYTLGGTVLSDVQATLTDIATVIPPAGATDTGCDPNCTSTASTPAQPTTGLDVTAAASPDPFVPGDQLTYTVTVTNSGPSDALGAGVSDALPAPLAGAGFSWSCTPSAGSTCTSSGSGDIADNVNVVAGGSITYSITGTVPSSNLATLINTATATPPAGATDTRCPAECSASSTTPADPTIGLTVTMSSSPNGYAPGRPLSYVLSIGNAGPSDAIGVGVSDPLPGALAGHAYAWTCAASTGGSCSSSGSGDILDTVTVAAGGTVTYIITGTVPGSLLVDLINTATINGPRGAADAVCDPSCATSTAPDDAPSAGP